MVAIPENWRCEQRNEATNDWKDRISISMPKDTWQLLASVRNQPENGDKLLLLVLPCKGRHQCILFRHTLEFKQVKHSCVQFQVCVQILTKCTDATCVQRAHRRARNFTLPGSVTTYISRISGRASLRLAVWASGVLLVVLPVSVPSFPNKFWRRLDTAPAPFPCRPAICVLQES